MKAQLLALLLRLGVVDADELAEDYLEAARVERVELHALVALGDDESNHDRRARGVKGEIGLMQLLPRSPYGRWWAAEASGYWAMGVDASEQLNVMWGARALADGLRLCKGSLVQAYGYYRTGRCVEGPRGRATAELAERVRRRLEP